MGSFLNSHEDILKPFHHYYISFFRFQFYNFIFIALFVRVALFQNITITLPVSFKIWCDYIFLIRVLYLFFTKEQDSLL